MGSSVHITLNMAEQRLECATVPCSVPCTSWKRLERPLRRQITYLLNVIISSYMIWKDGMRRCRGGVDLGPIVMSWQRFKLSCTYQADPVLCSSLHLHKLQQDFG